jgi:hypothetical protein
LAKYKIFNGRLIIERVRIVTSILIVEWEVGPRVPPLFVVVVAELVVVAIVDEAGLFPCFEIIIARMTDITANFAHHVLKDRLVDQRGEGSEWEPIKIRLQRENPAYAPNSQPRIPTVGEFRKNLSPLKCRV